MNKKDKINLFLIILFSLIGLYPFFSSGFFGYDFVFQGARLASFYKNLQEGVILPRWAGQLNSGYGHPVLIYLYPFVFYLGSVLHFLGFSIVNSIKALFIFGFIFSGIFAYFFGRKMWGERIGFLVAFIYLFSPYRFVNMYDRAALGEHMALCFMPLIFWSLAIVYQSKKSKLTHIIFVSLAFALSILSHNLVFLMASPLILVFWLYLYLTSNKNNNHFFKFIEVILGIILAMGLSAFFWLPVIMEKKYTLYDQIASPSYYNISLLPFYQLFISKNYRIFSSFRFNGGSLVLATISPIQWLLFLEGIYLVIKNWTKRKFQSLFLFFLTVYFLIGAFLTTSQSQAIISLFPQIAFVQQAFRFFNIPLLAGIFLSGIILINIKKKYVNLVMIFLLIINFLVNLPFFFSLKPEVKFADDKYFFEEYQQTADTGQITPRWGLINYETPPAGKVQLVEGDLKDLKITIWKSQLHNYTFNNDVDSKISDNTLYFPGWEIIVDNKKAPINFQDGNWIGIITYQVKAGSHQVIAKFNETKVRLLADYLSLASLTILVIGIIFTGYKKFNGLNH